MVEGFNPRARDGRESARLLAVLDTSRFNPRARDGRERRQATYFPFVQCFNPRARDGREIAHERALPNNLFQSTRP